MSAVPPLPPVARIADPPAAAKIHLHEHHTIPGWVGGLIYLALLVVLALLVAPRLPGMFG